MRAKKLTHFDASGGAIMVGVAQKPETHRVAMAGGGIFMLSTTLAQITGASAKKGDVLGVARIAGIQAAKRTSELIPLCHPLALTKVSLDFDVEPDPAGIHCTATVETVGRTGVEMEALTAVSVALLTIYDMCKAVDRGMLIESIGVIEKSGGRSGHWRARLPDPR